MRIPSSLTYRLQLGPEFGFDDAAESSPYLRGLGIGDVYLSPILASVGRAARTATTCIDPTRIDEPSAAASAASERLSAAAQAHGMGLLVDIVPNHMAADRAEPVVVGRPAARRASRRYARAFDIEWDAPGLDGKLLLPVLGKPLADALDGRASCGSMTGDRRPGRALLRPRVPARAR